MNLLLVILGLVLLILGGNWLLKSAVGISLRLNIPKIVIGMTVVSFATSTPELIVSIKSALDGYPDLAVGNVIGSNIANLGLVLAVTILISTITVEKSFYKTDWPIMMISSVLLYGFIAFDGVLQRYEGVILLSFLLIVLVYLLKFQKKAAVVDESIEGNDELSPRIIAFFLVLGGVSLWGGSELLIKGAVGLAKNFNISERVIGITIISIGTSIPELAASVIAVLKKEKAISLGNLIGSNMFNILAVLGITSIITPITISDQGLLTHDIFWMLGISILILPMVIAPVKMKLSWKEGLILFGLYLFFIIRMFK